MKSRYSFEDRGTDRQTEGIYFRMYSQRPFMFQMKYDTPTKAEN